MIAHTAENVAKISDIVDYVNRDSIGTYIKRGLSPSKINISFAFYAKWFETTPRFNYTAPISCPTAELEAADGSDTDGASEFDGFPYILCPESLIVAVVMIELRSIPTKFSIIYIVIRMDPITPEKSHGAWTDAEKLKEGGRPIKWEKINLPGRNVKSLQNMWTKINKQIRDLGAQDGDGEPAPVKAPRKISIRALRAVSTEGPSPPN
ncbi:hypothetical protein ACQKWADRAFT_309484 [Trichoderma austrokoningii]